MAQLNATELRGGTVFCEEGNLYTVLTYEHIKMGRGSGTIKVKVRNLKTGSVVEKAFMTGARVEEASIEKKKAQFLYQDGESYNFMDPVSYDQFSVSASIIGDLAKFIKEGTDVTLIVYEGDAIGIELPNTLIYAIIETGPEEKGNTVSNVFKEAKLDNGLIVRVPMFMGIGDKVKVDTRTGQYVERVK